ncbi:MULTISPECIES: hypothetical protein [Rhizobium]|uniref:Uncharacterized protein n=1 Tax=Rhizobium rhododendri TaxID=2506430 RepID=A0ABY8IR68_9HYPH|nr:MULTISPECIES: hypothetical protein [Rhizobium]TQX84315.1 hypothetical protein EQW76_25640 [Rhizobium sp. rho-13.1]TQY07856.1 hypothetical protein EQW74_24835 [Rhizobium sp. rho-1.1]WFS26221.1 hypothetical protein PR018_26490 [Rhizobium rhododendri]
MQKITFQYKPDDDHHGELTAFVQSGDFSGKSAAWFSLAELRKFEMSLGAYPIGQGDAPALLEGGFFEGDSIDQAHLSLQIVPIGLRGLLSVKVLLATPARETMQIEQGRNTISAEFSVTYGDLSRFQSSLQRHLNGERDDAVLKQSST